MTPPTAPLQPAGHMLLAVLGSALEALAAPVDAGSRRNAWRSVCRDRAAAKARDDALRAVEAWRVAAGPAGGAASA